MRNAITLALSLSALAVAGAANAADTDAPMALSDEQLDRVVAGDDHISKQEPAPGVIVVFSGEGATLFTSVQSSVHPPLVVIVDSELINETALHPPAP